jgi:hypothetical protein
MADASVPLSAKELEGLVETVAHNLYNEWAMDGRFPEEQAEEYIQLAVNDTVYVISEYMQSVNDLMLSKAQQIGIDV